jgi:heme-degrading monooxygenase HmoA
VYGSTGLWAKFFQQSPAYLRTELLQDPTTTSRYLTLDFWTSRAAYERFKTEHTADYHAIDEKCEALTENELEIGRFEVSARRRK